jgi:hypothetical protein
VIWITRVKNLYKFCERTKLETEFDYTVASQMLCAGLKMCGFGKTQSEFHEYGKRERDEEMISLERGHCDP